MMRGAIWAGALAAALLLGLFASPAAAEWKRAETTRFIVYSDGDARSLTEAALQLELYESALRLMHQLDPAAAPQNRIAIYLVGDEADLRKVQPELRENVAGFYRATHDDIFAIAIRERRESSTLLHEYAHHFMIGSFSPGFPAWFIEGYAEYFSSAQLNSQRITLGEVSRGRGDWLTYTNWLPLNLILTRRPWEFQDSNAVSMYYAQSWLMTHWFISDPARMAMFRNYVVRMQDGADPVAAMEAAVGMPIGRFEQTLRAYSRSRLPIKIITGVSLPRAEVTTTTLSRAENDLLLLDLRLTSNGDQDDPALLEEIRRRTAPYPTDPFARRLLARAELRLGEASAARTVLEPLVAAVPTDADARRLLGEAIWTAARDGDLDNEALLAAVRAARTHLSAAYEQRPTDFRTLYLLAETRSISPSFPNDNDMETLLAALELAPQASHVRLFAAQAHARRDELGPAIGLLYPLATSPHPDGATALARALIDRYRAEMDDTDSEAAPSQDAPAT